MPQLITIGETMAAFTPDSVGALRYVQNFGIRTAGAKQCCRWAGQSWA